METLKIFLNKAQRFTHAEMVQQILAIPEIVPTATWTPKFVTLHNTYSPSLTTWEAYSEATKEQQGDNLNYLYRNQDAWHCFSGDTKFYTSKGLKTFKECEGKTVEVLTPVGYLDAPIRNFGKQELYKIKLVQVTSKLNPTDVEILVTRNHHWPKIDGTLTSELNVGDVIRNSGFNSDYRICDNPWRVESIEYEKTADVYCAVLPNRDKLFILEHGILTHNSGPHFECTPEPWSYQLCDLTENGVHASCFNSISYGVEMVGNYEVGGDEFNLGLGALVRDSAVNVVAALHVRFGWNPADYEYGVKGLHFHHECVADHHACPGSLVDKSAFIALVEKRMEEIKSGVQKSPTPISPPEITITAWPELTVDPKFFSLAARCFNKWKSFGVSDAFAEGMLAQGEAECAFDTAAVGDNHSAYGLQQWHVNRVEAILSGTGIDVRTNLQVEDQVAAAWWELNHLEKTALAEIQAATTANEAGMAACMYYERAGAPGQPEKRGLMAERWAVLFTENPDLLKNNPIQPSVLKQSNYLDDTKESDMVDAKDETGLPLGTGHVVAPITPEEHHVETIDTVGHVGVFAVNPHTTLLRASFPKDAETRVTHESVTPWTVRVK